jgi:hypothetical protein
MVHFAGVITPQIDSVPGDVLQMRTDRLDRLSLSCDRTDESDSEGDISKPKSSFCVCDVIFDMCSVCVTSKRSWQSGTSIWITLRSGAGFNGTRRNSFGIVGESCL